MANKRVAGGISKIINQLHGIDKPEPLKEGQGYSTEGAGAEIKKTPKQKEVIKEKVNENLIWDLLQEGKYREASKLVNGNWNLMSPDQKEIMVEWRKLEQEQALQIKRKEILKENGVTEEDDQRGRILRAQRAQLEQMGNNFASGSGLVTSMLLSDITKPTEKQQKTPQQTLGALLTGNQQNKKQDITQTKTSGDPDRSKVSPGEDNPIRRNESEADVLAKTYLLMRKHQKWVVKKEKADKKYRKALNNQKEAFLDETIEALTGKKTTSGKKSPKSSKLAGAIKKSTSKSGFLKYGFMAAAGVGGLLVAKDALANINWDKKFSDTFSDFKFDFSGKNENSENQSRTGKNTKEGEYWNKMYDLIYKEAKSQGFQNPDIIASLGATQSALETGHGKHLIGGTSAFCVKGKGTIVKTQEFENGKLVTKDQEFQKYDTLEDSVKGYVGVLKQKNFSDVGKAKTVPEAIDAVVAGKYATAPNYGETLKEVYQSVTKPAEKTTSKTIPEVPNIAGIEELTKFTAYDPKFAREHNSFGAPRNRAGSHEGIDLGRTEGAPVVARETGTVVGVGSQKGYGYTVLLDHGNGLQSFYAHLKEEPKLERGQIIKRGEAFAKVGHTTGANGEVDPKMVPHLHLELRKNGKAVDPEEWNIKQSKLIMEERQTNEANLKKETKSKSNDKQISILNNNNNIIGGGTTYLISQENVSNYSPATKQQFNYLS